MKNRLKFVLQPGAVAIVAAALLPMMLFSLAAWQSYASAIRAARSRVERTTRVFEQQALELFETHRLALDAVDARLRLMNWADPAQRLDLHHFLQRMQEDLDEVATITITDAQGRMRASGRVYPADPEVSFADRDWFKAERAETSRLPFISDVYLGRQSGIPVFNVARRTPPTPDGAFDGAIAISISRSYLENFYKAAETAYDHSVVLVKANGDILAAEPPTTFTRLKPPSELLTHARTSPSGAYESRSRLDGVERFFAYRQVGNYPIYVRVGIGRDAALALWRHNVVNFGLISGATSLCLVAAAILALRQTRRWQSTASQLAEEAERRAQVEDQIRQLQKMEAIGQLTGGIAHDFNNMLSVIIGGLNLVQRRLANGDHNVERYVSTAIEGATRAATLTQRLLAFSRQQPLQPEVISVNELVASFSEILRRSIGEDVQLETVLGGGLWKTRVDANQLENAILNLAVNGRDAMPSGGRMTIETANADLDDAYARKHDVAPGQYVMIAVTDTGIGMSAETAAKAFDPFFTTKGIGKGTGLGLSQTYGFIKQSAGHIKIYSEVGHGTTFKIYLPRSFEEKPGVSSPTSGRDVAIGGRRHEIILVVDDEERVRLISVEALRDLGFSVLHAASGAEALDVLKQNSDIALLFTDVVMPGMSGRELADLVARDHPGTKVLFTTGYTRNAIVHNGALDPGVHLISKPFTIEQLATKVRALLDRA